MTHPDAADWPIQQIARVAGTTSRTLRHYDEIGLLSPTRIAPNGYRRYDEGALVRLQRILLLRQLGLGLPQIARVLDAPEGGSRAEGRMQREAEALEEHLAWLRSEQQRMRRQIASVERTITALREGVPIMAENMFDGFDHTQYKDEVEQRWGEKAYADGDRWWRGMSDQERQDWTQRVSELAAEWSAAAESGADAASDEAQQLARRHVEWLRGIPGTPAYGWVPEPVEGQEPNPEVKGYVLGLGEMYVADPRFAANYVTSAGGTAGAEFVRDALRIYAEAHL